MQQGFRARMGEMHTWVGLIFGLLLFAIFWTGTLSVFDKEIDRWMMPATRLAPSTGQTVSIDRVLRPILERDAAHAAAWTIILPSTRTPFVAISYGGEQARKSTRRLFDPHDMRELPPAFTLGASGFLYPFHHNLTLQYAGIGVWLVGMASVAMLCLLVSGIAAHRKIFIEFFTFRPWRSFNRSSLDLHNLSGVLVLPFYIIITLSGLIVAFKSYFPQAHDTLYAQSAAAPTRAAHPEQIQHMGETPERIFLREALGQLRQPKAHRPADTASLDAVVAAAENSWGKDSVYLIRVNNPKDANGNIVLRRHSWHSITRDIDHLRFTLDGQRSGVFEASPTVRVWNIMGGLHYLQFSHGLLRWLYFLGGLAGCVMIATGLFFWSNSRRKRHIVKGLVGVPLTDALNIAGVGGLLAATLAFFVANQVLPRQPEIWGLAREQAEILVFYSVWLLSLAHALIRCLGERKTGYRRAWQELLLLIAGLALSAVGLNGVHSEQYWLHIGDGSYQAVATMDGLLLLGALLALSARYVMHRRAQPARVGTSS